MSRITDAELRRKPRENDIWLTDNAPRGVGRFCARITPDRKRLFYFKYTSSPGRREYVPLGVYDPKGKSGLTLGEARAASGKLSLLYQSGVVDIKGHLESERRLAEAYRAEEEARLEKERKRAEIEASRISVKELFEKWEELRLSKRKDGEEIRRIFDKDVLPAIGHLPAHTIRKGHIVEITDKIELRGANRLAKITLTSLRTMFRYALARDFVEVEPTAALNKSDIGGKDVERKRALDEDEIKLLAKQLPSAGFLPSSEAAIWITLSTGCRIGELLKARWEHLDLDKRRWLIPSQNSKNNLPLEVYLSDFALKYFRLLERHRRSNWLYPARNKKMGDTHVSVKTVTKQVGDRQKSNATTRRTKNKKTLVASWWGMGYARLEANCFIFNVQSGYQAGSY